MLDPQQLRADNDNVAQRLTSRGFELDVAAFRELESRRKLLQTDTESLQSDRNRCAKEIGLAKARGDDAAAVMDQAASINDRLKTVESELATVQNALTEFISGIPNIPHASVPTGRNETDNVEIRRWGEPTAFSFSPKDHVDLGAALGMLDFEMAVKLTGSRFVVMYGDLVRLHRALIHFMIDLHTREHGYCEIYVPYLVNSDSLFGTGQLPKFADDQFVFAGDQPLYLVPTAEVPVTNTARDRILSADDLPQKMVCHTPCFRREAGSYGKDTRGMIRQHQFEKVELVHLVEPTLSWATLEELTSHAETVLQRLKLPYRVVVLCSGDIGFSAAKTYDIEVWLPGQNCYREISSCSNFEAFQARRMRARWRNPATRKPEFLHTLNGSGLAIGRTLVAVLENYQQADGSIAIPAVLRPYMGGTDMIAAANGG